MSEKNGERRVTTVCEFTVISSIIYKSNVRKNFEFIFHGDN